MARVVGALGKEFEDAYGFYANALLNAPTVEAAPHQMKGLGPEWVTREVTNQVLVYHMPETKTQLQEEVKPNLPWAEDHFQERVSGEPLNPPPSHKWWPYARSGNEEHTQGLREGQFSHTYPERMWPKKAGPYARIRGNVGIYFALGDLNDLIELLAKNPNTRQAYLSIWFPEDLTAAKLGERVPCTLGYHFLMRGGKLDMSYFIRSCDLVRFFRDDVYMACRLCQWVCMQLNQGRLPHDMVPLYTGILTMHIVSLHCFEGDLPHLRHGRDWRSIRKGIEDAVSGA